jgi:hypothetical protein
MPFIEHNAGEGVTTKGLRIVRGDYSFAADGGAAGTIALMGSALVPSGCTVLGGWLEVTTPPTSGGAATISVGIEAAGDLVAAAAVSGAPWSTAGRKSVVPVFTGATSIRLTAARDISIVIATAALTAGAFKVVLLVADPVA